MKLPFWHRLPSLRSLPVRQVVASRQAPAAAAALHQLLADLPDLLLATVLEVATGQPLATYAAEAAYQPTLLAGAATEAVRQLAAGLATQSAPGEELHEVLLTLPSQLHLLRLSADGQQVLYLAVDVHDTNLALARQLMQQAIKLLED